MADGQTEQANLVVHEKSPTNNGKGGAPLLTEAQLDSRATTTKTSKWIWWVVLFIVFSFISNSEETSNLQYDRYLIVISLDGFRSDYFNDPNISSPHIHEIAENGVHIERYVLCGYAINQ